MAKSSRGRVHAADVYVLVPPFLLSTCQRIRGECQPSIKSMSQKIAYTVGIYAELVTAVSSRRRFNSVAARNVSILSNGEGASWIVGSSLRLHVLFLRTRIL
jgi:hypothetical protein